MKTYIYSTAVETARSLIKHLISLMEEEPQKIFHIAFSGGSTPSLMFDLWAEEFKDATPYAYLLGGRTVCTCRRFGE
jgi:6-phosphogluconolactonase